MEANKIIAGVAFVSLMVVGCIRNIPDTPSIKSEEEYKLEMLETERNKIFKVYDNNIPNNIILAYEKLYGDTFNIAKNYLQYNKEDNNPTHDGFWIWLMKNYWYKDWFDKGDEFGIGQKMIGNRFNDKIYIEIQKSYELLERMSDEK